MPVFQDAENRIIGPVPEGDYTFTVTDAECKISNGAKTAGSDQLELELTTDKGSKVWKILTDHKTTAWKIDVFLKCCGVKLAKGEAYEFREDLAAAKGVKWINPLGLRGWARLTVEEYPAGSGKKRNNVATFYTDKPKLERVEIAPVAEEDKPF